MFDGFSLVKDAVYTVSRPSDLPNQIILEEVDNLFSYYESRFELVKEEDVFYINTFPIGLIGPFSSEEKILIFLNTNSISLESVIILKKVRDVVKQEIKKDIWS